MKVSCVKVASFWSYLVPYYLAFGILFEFAILINYIIYSIFVVSLVFGVILSFFRRRIITFHYVTNNLIYYLSCLVRFFVDFWRLWIYCI